MKKILRTLLVTGPLFTGLSTIAIFVVAVQVLAGCGAAQYTIAREVDEARLARAATLAQNKVAIFAPPPSTAELTTFLGEPSTYGAEDLTFDVYELRYDQVKALNELLSNRGINGDWLPVNESTFSGADAALLGLMVPGQIVMLPFTIIDLVMDPPGAGIEKIPKPRRLVFAYDENGNYRWQGCCFPPDFIDENGPSVTRLPDPANSANWKENPPDAYWADYQVLSCHNAKPGDRNVQARLFRRFNETVSDPVYAYYWATHRGYSQYLQWVENSLPPEALKAGEAYFLSHPLETVDCREVADMLVEAKSGGV